MGTVLIVDDEPGVRDGLARAVTSSGHLPLVAASLADAREALARSAGEIDCVLLDIRLKDGDGLDLLAELRAGEHRDVPVIMATAYGDSDRTIRAMKDGAFESPALRSGAPRTPDAGAFAAFEDMPLKEALAALEKHMIERALEKSGGNRTEAARALGIARPQLYAKMGDHELSDPKGRRE